MAIVTKIPVETEEDARRELAIAHRATHAHGMSQLVWNHISHRIPGRDDNAFLVTPGDRLFDAMEPHHFVLGSEVGNETADVIHGAVFNARPDVNAVVHA